MSDALEWLADLNTRDGRDTQFIWWLANQGCEGMGADGGPSCLSQGVYEDLGHTCRKPCWSCIARAYLWCSWIQGGLRDEFVGIHDIAIADVGRAYLRVQELIADNKALRTRAATREEARNKALVKLHLANAEQNVVSQLECIKGALAALEDKDE